MYVKDEGAILRRLLSAFSLRPTIVSVMPVYMMVADNNPFARTPTITDVTAIPMLVLRLPMNITGVSDAVNLEDALVQTHWYLEKNMIVPKSQSIIYSRDVLFFYVSRRYQHVNIARIMRPYSFTRLPMTVSGFEKLNDKHVMFNAEMQLMNELYQIRSVVLIEKANTHAIQNLIIGSTAIIAKHADFAEGVMEESSFLYDPLGAARVGIDVTTGAEAANDPITAIPMRPDSRGIIPSFMERAHTQGTIFIYVKKRSASVNPFYEE